MNQLNRNISVDEHKFNTVCQEIIDEMYSTHLTQNNSTYNRKIILCKKKEDIINFYEDEINKKQLKIDKLEFVIRKLINDVNCLNFSINELTSYVYLCGFIIISGIIINIFL